MAGLGSVFVELELDRSKFDRSLQRLEQDAKTMPTQIEDAFKNLGIKSSYQFDLMREKAVMNFERIKNASNATVNDILRAEQAKTATLNRLNEEQHGKSLSLVDGLKSHWLAATAAIAVAIGTISKAWALAKEGANFEEQRGILDNLSAQYSTTADAIVASMERASDGLVARADLMQVALSGIAKGLQPEQLINLADAARILGDAAGKDATTALKELTEALETGRARGLQGYLGTSIDLSVAFGDLESKMTKAEKAQALYAITMTEATKLQGQQSKVVDDAADRIERLEARYKNVTTAFSLWMKSLVVGLADFGKSTATTKELETSAEDLAAGLGYVTAETVKNTEAVKKNAEEVAKTIKPYEDQIAALKKVVQARVDADPEKAKKARDDAAKAETKSQEFALRKQAEDSERRKKEEAEWLEYLSKKGQAELDSDAKSREFAEKKQAEDSARLAKEEAEWLEYLSKKGQAYIDSDTKSREFAEKKQAEDRERRAKEDVEWLDYKSKKDQEAARKQEEEWRKSFANVRGVAEDAFEGMNRAMSTSMAGVILGTQKLEDAFKRMGENIVIGLIDSIVNRGLRAVENSLLDFVFGTSGASGGNNGGISLGGITSLVSSVGSMASGAWDWVTTFLGSFAGGQWDVPAGKGGAGGGQWGARSVAAAATDPTAAGWAVLHPGEMVLPPELATLLRAAMAQRGIHSIDELQALAGGGRGGSSSPGGQFGALSGAERSALGSIGAYGRGFGTGLGMLGGVFGSMGLAALGPVGVFGSQFAGGILGIDALMSALGIASPMGYTSPTEADFQGIRDYFGPMAEAEARARSATEAAFTESMRGQATPTAEGVLDAIEAGYRSTFDALEAAAREAAREAGGGQTGGPGGEGPSGGPGSGESSGMGSGTTGMASGGLFRTRGRLRMTVGEAGSETVAVLRNPRDVAVDMRGGGSGQPVVINLYNSGVIGNQLPDNLMREIQRELVRRESRLLRY